MASAAATSFAFSFCALRHRRLIISQKSLIFFIAACLSPNSSRSSEKAALNKDSPCVWAAAESAARDVSPIPLAGLFTMRLNDSSSFRLTASLKYAIISLTSARSKKEFPEYIT